MIRFRWFILWLGLLLLLVSIFGCGTHRIIVQPDVYINYKHPFYGYYSSYDYGVYYLYYPIVVQNTSITNWIEIELNGEQLLPQRIPPGKTENVKVRVEIGERRSVVLTAGCYTPSGKLTSTAHRELYLNIRQYEQPADIWPVYCRDQ